MQKAIFVTGAASGIGRSTALLFARRGWLVGLYDKDEVGLARVKEAVGEAPHVSGALDVTDADAVDRAVRAFGEATGGTMDALFNCAGILRMGRFEELPLEDYRLQIDINVHGVIHGIRAALPLLERTAKERGSACVLSMSSASAVYGTPELAVYSASKFAVRALTEALDLEFRKKKIRVVDIMPGYVDTPMVSSQTYRAKSLDKLGVKLTADNIAELVWRAAHGDSLASPVHYFAKADIAILSRLGGLLPEAGRRLMRHYTRS